MSDKTDRKNRNYGNYKESKRPTILAKRDDNRDNAHKSDRDVPSGPKILLKPKEPTISDVPVLAIREHRDTVQISSSPSRTIMSKELIAPVIQEQPNSHMAHLPVTTKPLELITSNFTLNMHCFDYLSEINTLFHVIGVIGSQGVGKSTLLNLLTSQHLSDEFVENQIFTKKEGVFQIHDFLTASTASDSVQMFVTEDRKILLDCSPVLANLSKKDGIMREIDDLKLIIFMLSVCHLVIVIQEDYFNLNLIRLIQNAEMMKPNFSKNGEMDHISNIMFIRNFAGRLDFTRDVQNTLNRMYKTCFKNSSLRIYSGCFSHHEVTGSQQKAGDCNVNTFIFPKVQINRKIPYYGHPTPLQITQDLRQLIFMSPRNSMINISTPFTEKLWTQLVANVWDSHKNNYFLRKYEKPNHYHGRDREFENSNNKDRYYD